MAATADNAAQPWRRSFAGGVLHGTAFSAHLALADPNTVLPAFVALLTPHRFLVGLVYAVVLGGEVVLQLLFGYFLQRRPQRKPFLVGAVIIRSTAWVILGATVLLRPRAAPQSLLVVFLVLVVLYAATGGLGVVAFTDIVGDSIPAAVRGRFYAARQLLGSLAALAAGYVVREALARMERGLTGYGALFLLSGVVLYAGAVGFALMAEQRHKAAVHESLSGYLHRAGALAMAPSRLRSLLLMQIASGAALMAAPFYALYARERLGLPPTILGTLVVLQTLGGVLGNPFWGWLRDRYGNLVTVRSALGLDLLAPVLALALGRLAPGAFPVLFLFTGAAYHGRRLGFFNCLVDLAPPHLRPMYAGINGTFTSPMLLFPLAGGALVETAGFERTFALAAAIALLPLATALRLPRPKAAHTNG